MRRSASRMTSSSAWRHSLAMTLGSGVCWRGCRRIGRPPSVPGCSMSGAIRKSDNPEIAAQLQTSALVVRKRVGRGPGWTSSAAWSRSASRRRAFPRASLRCGHAPLHLLVGSPHISHQTPGLPGECSGSSRWSASAERFGDDARAAGRPVNLGQLIGTKLAAGRQVVAIARPASPPRRPAVPPSRRPASRVPHRPEHDVRDAPAVAGRRSTANQHAPSG